MLRCKDREKNRTAKEKGQKSIKKGAFELKINTLGHIFPSKTDKRTAKHALHIHRYLDTLPTIDGGLEARAVDNGFGYGQVVDNNVNLDILVRTTSATAV